MGLAPTPGTTPNANARKDPGFKITVDGETFVLRVTEVSAKHTRRLRQETGYSLQGLFQSAQGMGGADLDVLSSCIWLARLLNGEDDLTISEVDETLTYGSKVEFEWLDDTEPVEEGEDPDPLDSSDESSGGPSPSSGASTA